jgi:opacity protein-like surface antigen
MKSIKSNAIRLLFSVALVMCTVTLALAQNTSQVDYPKVEVFVGYSVLGESSRDIKFSTASIGHGYAGTAGFETSVIRNFTKYIGLKGDFSAHFNNVSDRGPINGCTPTCTIVTQNFQIKTRVYNFLAGPEFKARNSTRITPFAHLLGGAAHTSANFTTTGPTFNILLGRSATDVAMAVGGGLDIRASRRVSFRGQMDYNPVFQNSASGGRRDLVRISLGVFFH